MENARIGIRAINAALARTHGDVASAVGLLAAGERNLAETYAEMWAAALAAGVRLPRLRRWRKAQFELALRKYPGDRHAAARYVGVGLKQFRQSCRRYSLNAEDARTCAGSRIAMVRKIATKSALRMEGGDRCAAAARLGISPAALVMRMRRYGIEG